VTVNFSTTYYLKLMLLTLCEQEDLSTLSRIVIVDNDSRDGGVAFLEKLAASSARIHFLRNRFNCTHANGLRKGISHIEDIERNRPEESRSNVILVCDTDIVFRNPQTLKELASCFSDGETVFAGELRHGLFPYPEAQASFFAVRSDCYARSDVEPIVHHGSPAYFMQRSLWRTNLKLADFPSNHGGYILHRGRSGVAASKRYHAWGPYATTDNDEPHYMGVEGGEKIWGAIENRYRDLLLPGKEEVLLDRLRACLGRIGTDG
jgi:glycosyltransferase involved in cell wall biosynthesis